MFYSILLNSVYVLRSPYFRHIRRIFVRHIIRNKCCSTKFNFKKGYNNIKVREKSRKIILNVRPNNPYISKALHHSRAPKRRSINRVNRFTVKLNTIDT